MKHEREVIERLARIEAKLDAFMADAGVEVEEKCPYCGHAELEDTSTADVPRMTCTGESGCGRSFNPEVSADG